MPKFRIPLGSSSYGILACAMCHIKDFSYQQKFQDVWSWRGRFHHWIFAARNLRSTIQPSAQNLESMTFSPNETLGDEVVESLRLILDIFPVQFQ